MQVRARIRLGRAQFRALHMLTTQRHQMLSRICSAKQMCTKKRFNLLVVLRLTMVSRFRHNEQLYSSCVFVEDGVLFGDYKDVIAKHVDN